MASVAATIRAELVVTSRPPPTSRRRPHRTPRSGLSRPSLRGVVADVCVRSDATGLSIGTERAEVEAGRVDLTGRQVNERCLPRVEQLLTPGVGAGWIASRQRPEG